MCTFQSNVLTMNRLRTNIVNVLLQKHRNMVKSFLNFSFRYSKFSSNCAILGIETSCDDTGCAIVNEKGETLSEIIVSQNLTHLRNGGIIPDIAQDLHRRNIELVVQQTLSEANFSVEDLSAIAVTVKPGLPLSLAVGVKYAKYLARRYKKPLIPIHHMEAHALIPRMQNQINFPFLVLLISGGHCLIAVAQDIDDFLLLGRSIDSAPGELFDKISRRMKLRNIPEYSQCCGGKAIELAAARATNPEMFQLPLPLAEHKDCNFSFNGLKTSTVYNLLRKEKEHNIVGDACIPEVNDLCASLLMTTTQHLIHRVQRAIEFCDSKNIFPNSNKHLILSGGVASNNFIYKMFEKFCEEVNFNLFRPIPKLCTDNGVMIAWNGVEKWKKNIDIFAGSTSIEIEPSCPLGKDLTEEVAKSNIRTKAIKLKYFMN